MKSDGSIIIDSGIDNSGFEQDAKKLKKDAERVADSIEDMGDSFEKTGDQSEEATRKASDGLKDVQDALNDVASAIGVSFGLSEIKDFASAAIETASDLQEVQNVVDTAFGDMSYQVEAFAQKSIKQFGMSELAAKQTAGRYMAMTTSMGITGQAATDMALKITGLTGDMASFYNVSQDVAATALASIWTGETESLKQYGIVMTQANLEQFALQQGINKTWNELTQAEQVQLRYNYVLEQTALAQGDFAKTQDSWANQTRILDENINSLQGTIGEGLMNAMTPMVELTNDIIGGLMEFQEATGLIDDFFLVIIGGVTGLLAVKGIDVIKSLASSILSVGQAGLIAQAQSGILTAGIGALVMMIMQLAGAWDSMTGAQKVVAVLGAITAAAFLAAMAIGAFQSAMSMGIAVAAIVAGIGAMAIAISAAQKSAEAQAKQLQAAAAAGVTDFENYKLLGSSVPRLATGAIIPPNGEFLAVLGDQKNGRNLEAPEGLIRQIIREEAGGGLSGTLTIRPAPGFTRYLKYELDIEENRAGKPLVEGNRR